MITSHYKSLSSSQATTLQKKYGYNEIPKESRSKITRILKKLMAPIPLMIEIAMLLSIILGRWEDFIIIAILFVVNIFVDFFQEQKAFNALEILQSSIAPITTVIRDNSIMTLESKYLVPGDVIKLMRGDIAPADVTIIDPKSLTIDQSTVTGESVPVIKTKGEIIYSGSIIQEGKTYANVTNTGIHSSIGKNAALVMKAGREKKSHFEEAILNIGKFLISLAAILIVIVFFVLILRGEPFIEALRFSLVLAIAAVPVALPAVLSVTMAIGAHALAKKKAIVSNFRAIEELAGIDQLCIDKTGTLTKNKISLSSPKVYKKFTENDLIGFTLLTTDEGSKNSLEQAILAYAQENSLLHLKEAFKIIDIEPFNASTKMTLVKAYSGTEKITIIMGAPQVIKGYVHNTDSLTEFNNDVETFAKDGFRTVAVAIKYNKQFQFVGLLTLYDPPRDDSASMVSSIKSKGIGVKMLTGDNTKIASFIAQTLHIGSRIINGKSLEQVRNDLTENQEDYKMVSSTNVFAEVIPEDKYFIVSTLQKNGHIVAMTGDGVNDAPALKKSDVGIAVSGASAVAQSAADIVLLGNGLSVIKKAIYQARMVFTRMQSYATFRIAETIRIIFFITLSIIIFEYSPLSAIMIILLALLNDIPVMSIAYDNAAVSEKPVRWHLRETIMVSAVLGIAGLVSSFLLFSWLNIYEYPIAIIQTILFLKLDVSGHSTLYITRTGRKHFWEKPYPSLKFFIPAFSSRIIGTIIALLGLFMEPISWQTVTIIWIYSTLWFFANDQLKVMTYKILDRYKKPNQD